MNDGPDKPKDLKMRLRDYALRIIRLYGSLPQKDVSAQILGKQVLRSGTSVGAHHRKASRARSPAEFIGKMEGGLQELEETDYWLDLPAASGAVNPKRLAPLVAETDELIAVFVSSVKTVKTRCASKD